MLRRSGLIGTDDRNVHSDEIQGREKELNTSEHEASFGKGRQLMYQFDLFNGAGFNNKMRKEGLCSVKADRTVGCLTHSVTRK